MNLKELRIKHNLKQQDIADNLQITRMKYNHYELGNAEPNIKMLIKLADFYKVTLDELIGHEVPYLIKKSNYTDVQLEIIKELENLNNEQSYMLLAYFVGLKSIQAKREQLIEKINK